MKLSIVTINRDNSVGLRRTLESTLSGQTGFDDWEQIVVDGASTDGSFTVLDEWKDCPRLGWHVSEPDTGIYSAMNKGAAHARGDYLLFLNSGDELLPNVLEKVFDEAPDADIVYGDELCRRGDGSEYTWSVATEDWTPAFFLFGGFPHQACLISRRLHESLGGYDETYRIVGDSQFLLRSLLRPGLRVRKLPLTIARYYLDGISSAPSHLAAKWAERRRMLTPVFGPFVANRATTYVSEERPWIAGQVAHRALVDRRLARVLRSATQAVAALWSFAPSRLALRAIVRIATMARSRGQRSGATGGGDSSRI